MAGKKVDVGLVMRRMIKQAQHWIPGEKRNLRLTVHHH